RQFVHLCNDAIHRAGRNANIYWPSCVSEENGSVAGFSHCFDWQLYRPLTAVDGIEFEVESISACVDIFQVKLRCSLKAHKFEIAIDFDENAIPHATARRMLQQLNTLLSQIALNYDGTIHNLDLISQAEREQLLMEWNETARPYP